MSPEAPTPWSGEDDLALRRLLGENIAPGAIAAALGRTVGDVMQRIARLTGQFGEAPACATCADVRWVCENHPDRPWDARLPKGCECGAGEPCPACNTPGAELPDIPDIAGKFEAIGRGAPDAVLPRRTYLGTRDGPPVEEAEHYGKCPSCGAWVDRRDLGAVAAHQAPLPHPAEDQPQ